MDSIKNQHPENYRWHIGRSRFDTVRVNINLAYNAVVMKRHFIYDDPKKEVKIAPRISHSIYP
jgi:hypothetical protein